MKIPPLLCFCWLLCACHEQGRKSKLSDLIKGDWVGTPGETEDPHWQHFWSFDDSTCLHVNSQGDLLPYSIHNDTLLVEHRQFAASAYTILQPFPDSLVLIPLHEKEKDTIKLSRVRVKNNIVPTVIYFASRELEGRHHDLKIDTSGNIIYSKNGYNSASGKISRNEYNLILQKINQLPVDSLKEIYDDYNMCFSSAKGVLIQYGKKMVRASIRGGHQSVPIELVILCNKLAAVPNHATLHADTTISPYYFLMQSDMVRALQMSVAAPPPPPVIYKFAPPRKVPQKRSKQRAKEPPLPVIEVIHCENG